VEVAGDPAAVSLEWPWCCQERSTGQHRVELEWWWPRHSALCGELALPCVVGAMGGLSNGHGVRYSLVVRFSSPLRYSEKCPCTAV